MQGIASAESLRHLPPRYMSVLAGGLAANVLRLNRKSQSPRAVAPLYDAAKIAIAYGIGCPIKSVISGYRFKRPREIVEAVAFLAREAAQEIWVNDWDSTGDISARSSASFAADAACKASATTLACIIDGGDIAALRSMVDCVEASVQAAISMQSTERFHGSTADALLFASPMYQRLVQNALETVAIGDKKVPQDFLKDLKVPLEGEVLAGLHEEYAEQHEDRYYQDIAGVLAQKNAKRMGTEKFKQQSGQLANSLESTFQMATSDTSIPKSCRAHNANKDFQLTSPLWVWADRLIDFGSVFDLTGTVGFSQTERLRHSLRTKKIGGMLPSSQEQHLGSTLLQSANVLKKNLRRAHAEGYSFDKK